MLSIESIHINTHTHRKHKFTKQKHKELFHTYKCTLVHFPTSTTRAEALAPHVVRRDTGWKTTHDV